MAGRSELFCEPVHLNLFSGSMFHRIHHKTGQRRVSHAFTLVEVVIALTIMALVFSGIILAFTTSSRRAEWTTYNLPPQNLPQQGTKQTPPSNSNPTGTP